VRKASPVSTPLIMTYRYMICQYQIPTK